MAGYEAGHQTLASSHDGARRARPWVERPRDYFRAEEARRRARHAEMRRRESRRDLTFTDIWPDRYRPARKPVANR